MELTDRQKEIKEELEVLIGEYLSIAVDDHVVVTGWFVTSVGVGTEGDRVKGINILPERMDIYHAIGLAQAVVMDFERWYTDD